MAEPSDEAKELRLVNNVELKIALADTGPKLQRLLNLYLPPLLLKLASPHAAVRNKVVSVCQHINTRTKPSSLQLPVAALLEQFKNPSVGGQCPLIRNFDLMYITVGIDRLPVEERLNLLPSLLKDISDHGNDHQHSLFNVLLRLLPYFTPPDRGSTEDTALREKLGFSESSADAEWLAGWFAKLMLLNLNIFTSERSKTCPGLSVSDVEFLTLGGKRETFYPFSVLSESKIAVLKFLASGAFTDQERYFTALIASTDSDSSVSGPADDIFKRCSGVSLEDESIVSDLYGMLLGRSGTPSAKLTLQTKVLSLMSKSRKAVDSERQAEITKIVDLSLDTSYVKLQQAAFSFITWTSRMADDQLTNSLAPGVIEKLRYWLLSGPQASDELKGSAYEMLALLASRCAPILIEPQLDLVRFLFQRAESEKGIVSFSVEGALGILLTRMSKESFGASIRTALEELILEVISRESRAVGQAVKWSGRLLGFGNVVGRWVGLLAIGMGGAVAEEGVKAMHPYHYRLINPEAVAAPIQDAMDLDHPVDEEDKYTFPSFSPLAEYIFATRHRLPPSLRSQKLVNDILPAKSFASALSFLKIIAIWESLPSSIEIKADEDWERNIEATITEESTQPYVEKFLLNAQQLPAVKTLLREAWYAMTFNHEGIEGVRYLWDDLAILVPDIIMEDFIEGLPQAARLLAAPKPETQRAAAMAVGVLGSHSSVDPQILTALLESLLSSAESGSAGAVWALGFLLSRLKLRGILDRAGIERIQQASKLIASVLADSRDGLLVDAAIEAVSELMVFSTFSTADVDTTRVKTALVTRGKKGDEKSVLALGCWTLLYPEDSEETQSVVEELFKIGESGGVELSFVVGEALATAAAGWGSSSVRKRRRIAGVDWHFGKRGGIPKLLQELLKRASEPGGGGKRRVNIVSLLSLFELCSSDAAVQERLGDAQNAFRAFLTDRDDFIQETASRGLTCIYNMSPPSEKAALVRSLVSSFTGEARPRVTVTMDTQLFEPGALPTGDGSSVGSYGDIMSLASELGDPGLVYKFMTLARHNSVWASRAAFGRFGLGNILSSSEEVKNNGKLWPVLFRYRFDPNNGVRASMDNIWNALGGGQDTIERWFDGIVNECLKGAVHGGEWRVREASVSALANLLGGRKLAGGYRDRLEEIWKVAFKVLDDVKESVRVAAFKLCKTLTNGMVRVVEGNETMVSEKTGILGTLMGFLMGRQGLEAEAKDVQMFSLATLLQIVKTGTPALHLFVPELLERFLLAMSDLEPQAVNYLIMNADKYNTTGEDIDRIRLNSIRQSPIMSAIELLVDTLDAQTLQRLLPVLQKSVKISLGLPSKVGCSRVIVNLVMRKPTLVKACADELAKTILAAVIDRSEVVSKSYAVAAGYLCRVASDESILKVVLWAQQKYWEREERERRAAGAVVEAVWKHATDRANALAVDILPFVFIAKGDTDPTVAEEFVSTWNDNTGGPGSVKLYLKEIVQLTTKHIASARWSTKQTCALALADAANSIAQDTTAVQLQTLWPALVTAVGGKSWNGKEKVLEAFIGLAVKGKGHLDAQKIEELQKICVREAKRNNITYRGPAIKCLGALADGIDGVDIFETIYEIVVAAVSDEDQDGMDVDGEDGRSGKQLQQITLVSGIRAVAQAFRPSRRSTAALSQHAQVLELLDKHISRANIDLKACSIEAVEILLNRLADATDVSLQTPEWEREMDRTWSRILERLKDRNYEAGRTKASRLIETFARVIGRLGSDNRLLPRVKADLRTALEEEKSSIVLQVLRVAVGKVLQDG